LTPQAVKLVFGLSTDGNNEPARELHFS
jgi:hypothetical protein